jgi:Peptidase family M1 domain
VHHAHRHHPRTLLIALTLCLVTLSACTRTASSGAPIALPDASGAPSDTGALPGQLVAPGALPVLDSPPERPLYTLNATLDYASGVITAQQRIEFVNPAGVDLTEIKFNVPPGRRSSAVEFRDARIYGAETSLPFTFENAVLTVRLPATLPAGKAVAITFDFTLRIPLQEVIVGIGGDDTSRGPFSLTAGHWYVMLAPYRDGAWDTPSYVPIGDPYSSELADYEVSVLAPEGITVAGSGDETRDGRLWRYSLKKARVFAFAASDSYVVDTLTQNGVTFVHYGYPANARLSPAVLNTAARAVKLFGELYGPYPYQTLRIVETGRQQGQEYSGMVGIGTTIYRGYPGRGSRHDLIATTVHEVAHQWWFNVVGNDQIRTAWLDESVARMAELRFYQTYYDNDSDWWFSYYIIGRQPKGPIDLSLQEYEDSSAYIQAVYQRGLLFLNDIRKKMGRDAFDAMMRDFYRSHEYDIVTEEDFFDALARHSDEDFSPLVKGYFARPVRLPCKISGNTPGCR